MGFLEFVDFLFGFKVFAKVLLARTCPVAPKALIPESLV